MVRHHPRPLPTALAQLDRTLVMGVVNVTPDSFSDGGLWL
ncbi:MAG TPA: dihydropteroate synthase, partial [Actinotalea sp.]